jgi:copper chaperone CopZ
MEKIMLKVTRMSCAHCEKNLSNAMEDIGAKVTKISAKENFAEIEYDPENVSLEAVKAEICDVGYEVE